MTSSVTYNGHLRTTAIHVKSGQSIITDAPTDNNGKGEAFSPTDLVATALASCMITVMGIKSISLGIDLSQTTAEITKLMTSNPRRIAEIKVLIRFPENNWDENTKTVLKNVAKNCPVAKSISEELVQTVEFKF